MHPGYDQGIGTQARFFGPLGVAADVSGNPWVADADDGYSGGCRPKRTCRDRDAHGVRYWKRAWDRSSGSSFTASTASARLDAAFPSCGRRFHKRSCLLSRIRTNASLLIASTEHPSHCHDWLALWNLGASVTVPQQPLREAQDENQFLETTFGLLAALSPEGLLAGVAEWTSSGPDGGAVVALAAHPSNPF